MSRKAPGVCAFCGSGKLSKQHLWPDWLAQVLPRESGFHTQQQLTPYAVGNPFAPDIVIVEPEVQRHEGHPGSRKVRAVCRKCNSGWMSQVENAAKPHLARLIAGAAQSMDACHQEAVAAWVMLAATMQEFTDVRSAAIPVEQRRSLMTTRRPPSGWSVWIGHHDSPGWTTYRYHHEATLCLVRPIEFPPTPRPNTQSSSFGLGHLFVHATSSTVPGLDIDLAGEGAIRMHRIWPVTNALLDWPPGELMSDVELNSVAFSLSEALGEAANRFPIGEDRPPRVMRGLLPAEYRDAHVRRSRAAQQADRADGASAV